MITGFFRRALSGSLKPMRNGQDGVALILSMIVLVAVSAVAIGLNMDVKTDIGISGNLRHYTEAFNRAEGGLGIAQEALGFSVYGRGVETESGTEYAVDITTGSTTCTGTIKVSKAGDSIYFDGGHVVMSCPGGEADVKVTPAGAKWNLGSAIQMAAGYEGLGKGAGTHGAVLLFSLESTGSEKKFQSGKTVLGETYRNVVGSGGL